MDDQRDIRSVGLRIHGRVQGVWYRGWTIDEARARGLSGWVRNRRDGSVEARLEGPPAAVAELIDVCRQGPPAARVDRIDVSELDPGEAGGLGPGFEQRPTE